MRELGLFREWFLQRHLGVALDADEDAALAGIESLLADAALAQPQVLVHRDFMLRNLMPVADGPAVLDFQDAVRGPIDYDVLSLCRDSLDRKSVVLGKRVSVRLDLGGRRQIQKKN